MLVVNVLFPEFAKVKLLKVVADADSVWFPAAVNLTVLVPAVKREPVPPQAVLLTELILIIQEPPFRVPIVRVTLEKVWVSPTPKFKVPPDPLMVRPFAPKIAPVLVAVPPVLNILIKPEVVKDAIDCVAVP